MSKTVHARVSQSLVDLLKRSPEPTYFLNVNLLALKNLLNEQVLKITFRKVDQSIRVMNCTTNPMLIPDEAGGFRDSYFGNQNENQVRVWDLDKHDWRSFRFDNVTLIEQGE